MADIFFSYASDDREAVSAIVELLEREGWSVWWDRSITVGQDWEEELDERLDDASCVVVAWTPASVKSRWVRAEASEGLARKILVPLKLLDVRPPLQFRHLQTADLIGWPEREGERAELLAAIRDLLADEQPASETTQIGLSRPTVLVLPFSLLSRDASDEVIADGMTEDVITLLSHHPSFNVLARNTTFSFKGAAPDVQHLRSRLGIEYVVEGGVRRYDEMLRITVQLTDSSTGSNIWSEKYDVPDREIFNVQDQIERSVVNMVGTQVRQSHRARIVRVPPNSLDAWGLVTRAETLGYTSRRGLREQLELVEQALAIDPQYALAHARKAFLLAHKYVSRLKLDDSLAVSSVRSAESALSISPLDPLVLYNTAYAFAWCGERERGVSSAQRAVELAPIPVYKGALVTTLLSAGRVPEAIELGERIWPDLPRDMRTCGIALAQAYTTIGDYGRAIEWARRMIDDDPRRYDSWLYLANAFAKLGRSKESAEALQSAMRIEPRISLERYWQVFERIFPEKDMAASMVDGLIEAGFK